ncbi:MAG TPA: TraR/DksA family transcriptional regulator [Candidatus Binatia bacterium]|nr:TraR/DksA family transcriptional regulator [Candidatus Binatia bacterium]
MRKAFLKSARASLLDMRKQTLDGIESETKFSREGSKDEGMDAYDLASEERDRDISLILSDRDRQKLQAIDDALERIQAGSYGICEICELDIAEERLKALPFTRLCVTCQADQEREAKQTRRPEDERGYRRFAVGDTDEETS